jgi:hypothetical protein
MKANTLGRLRDHGILPAEIYQLFGEVRRSGNAATRQSATEATRTVTIQRIDSDYFEDE